MYSIVELMTEILGVCNNTKDEVINGNTIQSPAMVKNYCIKRLNVSKDR